MINKKAATDSRNTKKKNKITLLIIIAAAILTVVIVGLIFYMPEFNAKREFSSYMKAMTSDDVEGIVVSMQRPFETGTLEQVSASFERMLTDEECEKVTSLLEVFEKSAKYAGEESGLAGVADMKITLFTEGGRKHIYISEEYAYFLNGALRKKFTSESTELYDYLIDLKNKEFGVTE